MDLQTINILPARQPWNPVDVRDTVRDVWRIRFSDVQKNTCRCSDKFYDGHYAVCRKWNRVV